MGWAEKHQTKQNSQVVSHSKPIYAPPQVQRKYTYQVHAYGLLLHTWAGMQVWAYIHGTLHGASARPPPLTALPVKPSACYYYYYGYYCCTRSTRYVLRVTVQSPHTSTQQIARGNQLLPRKCTQTSERFVMVLVCGGWVDGWVSGWGWGGERGPA